MILVDIDVAVLIDFAYKDRIYRCNVRREVHHVGRAEHIVATGGQVRRRFRLSAYIAHVGTQLQPRFGLIVGLQAGRESLVRRRLDDTLLIQVVTTDVER